MDEKKIKQIISNNIDLTKEVIPNSKLWSSENTLRVFTERCIKTAIQEFLKDLWHDASEVPENRALLVELKIGKYIISMYSQEVKLFCKKWCYLSDILPKQKGGSK